MEKALIIDDEIDICFLLCNLLKSKEVHSDSVNTLADATIALQKNNYSVVFLDNHLPDGMGIDFIRYVKRNSSAKIVMITAYDNASDHNKAQKLGVDMFIGKPFNRDTIFQAVNQLVA